MCDEDVARAALRALGLRNPSPSLVENWIRANRAELEQQSALAPEFFSPRSVELPAAAPSTDVDDFRRKRPRGYSKSNLDPVLREQGTLEKPGGVRKPGRPPVRATWFEAVARSMVGGTTLREALQRHGITLDKRQIRALYRNKEFRRLYQEARYKHQHEDSYFKKRLTREERFRRML